MRSLKDSAHQVRGIDILPSPYTHHVGSISDQEFVKRSLENIDAVIHTATLHKPHVATHVRQEFVDTNISGTLHLLEESVLAGIKAFVFTSTTSVFGDALTPHSNSPAAWITEDVPAIPKNIYGLTKATGEDLCQLFHRNLGLPCLILRTSRFFLEADDSRDVRQNYDDSNAKVNEFLFRRVDVEDVVNAHLLALEKAPSIGFGKYIISATSPFTKDDLFELHRDAARVLRRIFPDYEAEYRSRNWRFFPKIDRIYVNQKARDELGWNPQHNFADLLERLKAGRELHSALARSIGSKGYHAESFSEGPYPVEGRGLE